MSHLACEFLEGTVVVQLLLLGNSRTRIFNAVVNLCALLDRRRWWLSPLSCRRHCWNKYVFHSLNSCGRCSLTKHTTSDRAQDRYH